MNSAIAGTAFLASMVYRIQVLLPTPRERAGDWLKLNAKQFGRLRACGRRRGRAAIRKEKRRPAWLAW
jgi:hypothetical protein